MILYLFLRWYVKSPTVNQNVFFYGGAVALLADVFLFSLFIAWLKVS